MARMPSVHAATPSSPSDAPAPVAAPAAPALQLAQACRALWVATLSLMTAFMQLQAPAHRCLLARRIARNLETLARQECFDAGCRARFARLAPRWHARAQQFAQ
jgi:hypothetical protein